MEERQQYIRDNFSPSDSVALLYEDEKERAAALSGWQEKVLAPAEGYISWFTDGLEESLSASKLSGLTASLVKQSLNKNTAVNNRREGEVAKIIRPERLYISGVEQAFKAQVYDIINERDKIIVFEISGEDDVRRALGMRSVRISINSPISQGFIIPSGFIREDENGLYVYVLDSQGKKKAVYINRLAEEDNQTLVSAKDGGLSLNGAIYSK